MTVLAVAGNAFRESIRQSVFVVLMCTGILALVMNVNLAAYTLEDDNKLLIDLGLSTLFLIGLLLAALTATSVLGREIENKTVLTVVSKPVSRTTVIAGKWLGVSAAIGLAYWVLAVVFLLTVRHRVQSSVRDVDIFDLPVLLFGIAGGGGAAVVATLVNYFYRRPFASTFAVSLGVGLTAALAAVACVSRQWKAQHPLTDFDPQLIMGLVLVFEAIALLVAVAIAASTRLGQTATLMVCLGVFLVGLVSEYFVSLVAGPGSFLPHVVALVPNLQYFWPADALTQRHPMTLDYVGWVSLYALIEVVALCSLAVVLFQRRDVG